MLEADQVHGWAIQLQLQHLAIEYNVELGSAVFMGIQAAVFGMVVLVVVVMVFVFVFVRGNRAGQGQQSKRQGKEQAAHGDLRGWKSSRYVITTFGGARPALLGAHACSWEHGCCFT
jgi:hypothetical protein